MLALQLQILNSLTQAASSYADLYADLLRAAQPKPEPGRSWYKPPAPDAFSGTWPFMMPLPNNAMSPFLAFAMMGPWAWQSSPIGQSNPMFAGPLAMMNFWAQAWGGPTASHAGANSFGPLWPWDNSSGPQNSLTPDYGMIKMSITFPDETEIKFSFPGLPA